MPNAPGRDEPLRADGIRHGRHAHEQFQRGPAPRTSIRLHLLQSHLGHANEPIAHRAVERRERLIAVQMVALSLSLVERRHAHES